MTEPLLVVAELGAAFDRLAIPYLVGGSLASSMYGIPRSIQVVDLVARMESAQGEALAEALEKTFHVDKAMIAGAIAEHYLFNVIHRRTLYKADVFVAGEDPWIDSELERARVEELELEGKNWVLRFASPEDVLLHKLVWYRMGGEVSGRQWEDVDGILKVQSRQLDSAYLERWAEHLGVSELLSRLRDES